MFKNILNHIWFFTRRRRFRRFVKYLKEQGVEPKSDDGKEVWFNRKTGFFYF